MMKAEIIRQNLTEMPWHLSNPLDESFMGEQSLLRSIAAQCNCAILSVAG